VTLVDLYHQYASGQLDLSTDVSAELVTSHMSEVTTCNNRSKIKFKIPPAALTMVSGADENLVIYFMWPNVSWRAFGLDHPYRDARPMIPGIPEGKLLVCELLYSSMMMALTCDCESPDTVHRCTPPVLRDLYPAALSSSQIVCIILFP